MKSNDLALGGLAASVFLYTPLLTSVLLSTVSIAAEPTTPHPELFSNGGQCIACHSNMVNEAGENISIGYIWRASMMANAGRDPYWLATVRREVMDHPPGAGIHQRQMLNLPPSRSAFPVAASRPARQDLRTLPG